MNSRRSLFYFTTADTIVRDSFSDAFVSNLTCHLKSMKKIVMTCYRAGPAITELVIHTHDESLFCLTIWQGDLSVNAMTTDDLRLGHKEISLPDAADIFALVTTLARYAGLSPSLNTDNESSSFLVFSS
ncbi:hypothetical protein [Pantoea sp. App145]|uniref:hypothetical protein n=1 Tax=Pantoea sp. App145 TaxID=3071567 RepID=UPI003A80DDD8